MYNLSIISNFGLDFQFQTEFPCELYVDIVPVTSKNSVRVLWVLEPDEISVVKRKVIDNYDKFDLILTWDEEIIKSCPNSKIFPYGTTWVKNFNFPLNKEFSITTLVGNKRQCVGHNLRHRLVENRNNIQNPPLHIFNSQNSSYREISGMKMMMNKHLKNELFYSQYHIVIENVISNNWFTEKIIDCFQTKTLPIYIGCPNIGTYFNAKGIFHVESLEELFDCCKNITESTYYEKIEYVNENYKESFKYIDHEERIKKEIEKFLNP